MKISIFTIADYVTEQDGKLIIVGSFDNWLSQKFPFVTIPFGIAIKGYVENSDYGKEKTLSFKIRPRGKKKIIFEIGGKIKYPAKRTKKVDAVNTKFMIAGIPFDEPGVYEIECIIESKVQSSFLVEVIDTPLKKSRKKLKKKAKKKAKKK